jgi:hypothetical protein
VKRQIQAWQKSSYEEGIKEKGQEQAVTHIKRDPISQGELCRPLNGSARPCPQPLSARGAMGPLIDISIKILCIFVHGESK